MAVTPIIRRLEVVLDANGKVGLGLSTSTWIDNLVLVAATAKAYTIPTGAHILNFSSDCDFWVNPWAVAVVPIADNIDGDGLIYNPGLRWVIPVDGAGIVCTSLSLISTAGGLISIEVYA